MEQLQEQEQQPPQELLLSQQSSLQAPNFEDLVLPNENYFQQINQNFEKFKQETQEKFSQQNEWQKHFDMLNDFRIWNKFNNQQFCSVIIDEFLQEILNACENLRSQVQRLGLKLIQEIYMLNQSVTLSNNVVSKLTQKLYEKANFEKKFIRDEALSAIKSLEQNSTALSSGVFSILQNLCYDKNFKVCELACNSLHTILEKNTNYIKQIDQEMLNSLINTLSDHIDGKRAKLKLLCKQMCTILKNQLSEKIFEILPTNKYNTIKRLVLEEKKTARKPNNFKDFKRTQTSMLKSSNISSTSENGDGLSTINLQKAQSMDVVPEFQNNNNSEKISDFIIENNNNINQQQQQTSNGDLNIINSNFKKSNCVLQETTDKNFNNENISLSQQNYKYQQQQIIQSNGNGLYSHKKYNNNENCHEECINPQNQKSQIRMEEETDEL